MPLWEWIVERVVICISSPIVTDTVHNVVENIRNKSWEMKEPDKTKISITDNGIGIREEMK
jgi:hypothetical protein